MQARILPSIQHSYTMNKHFYPVFSYNLLNWSSYWGTDGLFLILWYAIVTSIAEIILRASMRYIPQMIKKMEQSTLHSEFYLVYFFPRQGFAMSSRLALNSWPQAIFLSQFPQYRGLQVCTTALSS